MRLNELFLDHDPPKKRELRRMNDYIEAKLEIVTNSFPIGAIRRMIVTSGTAATVVCALREISRRERALADRERVTAHEVELLYERLSSLSLRQRRDITGISTRRAEVIVPGVAVLRRILQAFHVRSFTYSTAGVRDGIIAQLATHGDDRDPKHEEHFHVFLCHNAADKPAIRDIAERLRDRGIVPWLDEEQIRPGTRWQRELQKQIASIRSAAVFVGREGVRPWQDLEVEGFFSQFLARGCPIIPVLLPGAKKLPEDSPFLQGMMAVDLRRTDPDPFEDLVWGITGEKVPVGRAPSRRQRFGGAS